jgi:hypothetical protein
LAKHERERSMRKQAATMSMVTVATDQVGVSASDHPCSAAIPPRSAHRRITRLPPPSVLALICPDIWILRDGIIGIWKRRGSGEAGVVNADRGGGEVGGHEDNVRARTTTLRMPVM